MIRKSIYCHSLTSTCIHMCEYTCTRMCTHVYNKGHMETHSIIQLVYVAPE